MPCVGRRGTSFYCTVSSSLGSATLGPLSAELDEQRASQGELISFTTVVRCPIGQLSAAQWDTLSGPTSGTVDLDVSLTYGSTPIPSDPLLQTTVSTKIPLQSGPAAAPASFTTYGTVGQTCADANLASFSGVNAARDRLEECASACSTELMCSFFTWYRYSQDSKRGWCKMYSSCEQLQTHSSTVDEVALTFTREQFQVAAYQPRGQWMQACPDSAIVSSINAGAATADACATACDGAHACLFFSFWRFSVSGPGGWCKGYSTCDLIATTSTNQVSIAYEKAYTGQTTGWCGPDGNSLGSCTWPACVDDCRANSQCTAVRYVLASKAGNLMSSCDTTNTDTNWEHVTVPSA